MAIIFSITNDYRLISHTSIIRLRKQRVPFRTELQKHEPITAPIVTTFGN